MGWFVLAQLVSTLISMLRLGRLSDSEKDLEILILRHQLHILERKQKQSVRSGRAEKLYLVILTARLKQASERSAGQLDDVICIFQPETVLRWHRELVRRMWTFRRQMRTPSPSVGCAV